MDQKVGIAFCCEKGELERLTRVMVKSLLKYGQLSSQIKLFCFCPRPMFRPNSQTLSEFKQLGITIIDEPLNKKYSFYPLVNKVVALKYLEEYSSMDRLIFLDSDMIILNNILGTEMMDYDISIQSEILDLITAKQIDDAYFPFWDRLYKLFEIKELSFTNTFVSGKRIFAYWNSGLISYKRKLFIATKWYENLSKCFDQYHWRKLEYYFLEQAALAVTIQQLKCSTHKLKPGFNYPICFHEEIYQENKVIDLNKLHIIHYFRETKKSLENLEKIGHGSNKVGWVEVNFKSGKLLEKGFFIKLKDFYYSFRQSNLQKIMYFYNRFTGKIK